MPLSAYALITLQRLKNELALQGSGQDHNLESAINRASAWLEQETERKFITRGEVGEFHTVRPNEAVIRLAERPIISVTSVHESTTDPRVYDADSILTVDTDYQIVAEGGQIVRLSASEPYPWALGYRTIKVLYDYGYTDEAAVPADLKHLCLFVASGMFKEADRARWGLSSVTDAQGSVTRFLGYLPPDMRAHLDKYCRGGEFERTWEAA